MNTSFRRIAKSLFMMFAAALLGACASTVNTIKPSATFSLNEGVSYGAHTKQKLDIYTPTGTAPAGGWPVVVFFFGGSWNSGERSQYQFVGEALASRGVLTMVASYRLYPEVSYPDFLSDSGAAMAYGLREAGKLGGDPKRVFVMGHSAGGYNAAMVALDDRWLKAAGSSPSALAGWIGLAGPYDFLPIQNPDVKPVFHHPNYPSGSQPIDYATKNSPRTFLGAANTDKLVDPQRNTVGLANKLKAQGVPVTVKLYNRVNHVTLVASMAWSLRWLSPVLDDVAAFIQQK